MAGKGGLAHLHLQKAHCFLVVFPFLLLLQLLKATHVFLKCCRIAPFECTHVTHGGVAPL